jgi:ABC-type multidrug transport system fused ATPase/permease subunit
MENNGFERFSKAWKKSGRTGSTEKFYAEEDIKAFKMKKSKDFSQALNRSLVFDFIQKTILIAAMLLLVWFYRTDMILIIAITGIIGLSVYLLFREGNIKREYQKIDDYSRELSTTIKEKISFFRTHFPSLQWMLAFTNALLVWVGSLFYFYAKYGRYRIDDVADIVVNLLMLCLAFAISFVAYRYQYKFNLNELEENLADLDDEAMAALHIQIQKRRKKRLTIGLIILIIGGLLLLAFLVINFMSQGG